MRLRLSLEKGMEVVIPKSMSLSQANKIIPKFVYEQQDWIERSIKKLQKKKQLRPIAEECLLPDKINVTALNQVFYINYDPMSERSLLLHCTQHDQLLISGSIKNNKAVFNLFEQFFKQYARRYLQQRLDELSSELNLSYNRLTIRAQKTRWGSCSSKKNINLNYKLIFVDKALLDYVIIHELLHTVHMNHSKAYWSALESILPGARSRDKQLNLVNKSLPCWMFN